eukprot:788311-Rhodomonas_salina.3
MASGAQCVWATAILERERMASWAEQRAGTEQQSRWQLVTKWLSRTWSRASQAWSRAGWAQVFLFASLSLVDLGTVYVH